MLRAFLFDCDGVLADTESLHYRSLSEALRAEGVPLTLPDYAGVVGLTDRESVESCFRKAGREPDPDRVEAVTAAKADLYARSLEAGVPPVPGAADFVRRAAETYVLGVASGSRRSEVLRVLEGLAIADRFRAVVAAEDCPTSKPDPGPYLAALAALNASVPAPDPPLEARDCLVFEDSELGVRAARAAGMRCIALTTTLSGDQLRDADLVAQNFRALDLRRVTAFFDRRSRG